LTSRATQPDPAADYSFNLGYCRILLDYLSGRRLPLQPVLDCMGLRQEELSGNVDRRIPRQRVVDAFELAATVTGDPHIGMHAAEHIRPVHFGVLGYILMSCETFGEVLRYRERWIQLVSYGETWGQERAGSDVVVYRSCAIPEFPDGRQCTECGLASQVVFARWISGHDEHPSRVRFNHPRPADLREHRRIFGCELLFDAPRPEIHFPADYLQRRLMQSNPELLRMMSARAEQLAAGLGLHGDPTIGAIRRMVAQRIAVSVPALDDIAQILGVSTRVLQRNLAAASTTYMDVVEETRKQIALGYLQDPQLSLVDIAFLMGFSEQSAFNRAFKRWTGITPAAARQASKSKRTH
jgi:AraC-like DNA-binding protein